MRGYHGAVGLRRRNHGIELLCVAGELLGRWQHGVELMKRGHSGMERWMVLWRWCTGVEWLRRRS